MRGQLHPPPGAAAPSGGGGASPLPRGGWRAGSPVARRPERGVGGRGEGGPRRGSPPPCPGGGGPWPPTQSPFISGAPPLDICVQPGLLGSPGRWARPGWSSVGQPGRGGGGAASAHYPRGLAWEAPRGGGRGDFFAAVCSPAFPGRAPRRVASSAPHPPCCIPGCRCSAAAHGVPLSAGAELPVGSGHHGSEWAANRGCLARGRARRGRGAPPLGAAALSGGARGRRLPGRPPAVRGPGGGGERGGEGGWVPRSPPLVP